MRGDKYNKVQALSKIFEEMLSRQNPQDDEPIRKRKAAGAMDRELGPAWRKQAVTDDIGAPGIEIAIIEAKPLEPDEEAEEMDETMCKARSLSEKFVRPGDDLEFSPSDYEHKAKGAKKSGESEKLSDELLELVKQMRRQGL